MCVVGRRYRAYSPSQRKYGTRYVKRPGVEALLLGLTRQGFEIVFWSEASMATAEEPLIKIINVRVYVQGNV